MILPDGRTLANDIPCPSWCDPLLPISFGRLHKKIFHEPIYPMNKQLVAYGFDMRYNNVIGQTAFGAVLR